MEQIFRRKTECKFRSVLVDNKKIPNVNLHEISISKIKHPLMFCFCTIWKTNGSKVLFLLQLITVFFSHTDSNKNISRPWASLTVKNKILLVSVVAFFALLYCKHWQVLFFCNWNCFRSTPSICVWPGTTHFRGDLANWGRARGSAGALNYCAAHIFLSVTQL